MTPPALARQFQRLICINHEGAKLTLIHKVMLSVMILFATNLANAATNETEAAEALNLYHELSHQTGGGTQPFMQLMSRYVQATLAAGRCTGSWDCQWPTNQCVNNRCVKPNGDSGECAGNWDCQWPTNECRAGRCVKPNGDGGECTGSWDCEWPYSQCKKGYCERP
jgi:hypothetical protein